MMRFEARDLKGYPEPLSADELKEGEIYFWVEFYDNQLLVPALKPFVFVGRNMKPGDTQLYYFQEIDSYLKGARLNTPARDMPGIFMRLEKDDTDVYDYERALEILLRCSLRRRAAGMK